MEIVPNEEEIAIDVILLAIKSPRIIDGKIHKEGKKIYYQIVRANGKSQMYLVFSHMLKSFDSEDLEDLYKLVKARYGSTRPVEDLDLLLWNDLKNMFEPHAEDVIYMLVEKNYPLTPPTISQMLEKKLQIDYEIEMAYQLCKLIIKQLKKGGLLGLKVFLMLFRVTATLIDVNAAQSKLVLLENFNKNYSKCLRLLYKVNAAEGVNAASEEVNTAEKELKLCEAKTVEPSVDEPPEVELKELPPHLEYAFLEGDNKLPVIIAKDLKDEEKAALLKVLKSHKRAIAWTSDITGV
ncbi:hypothetical protein Tco_1058114 [Tanacetum coccineum]|uniref:Reverse transcriptase domain-containing protein n=1 Tax=Tanacetum coccineum TaxID=301880 RepID=A0ABQ5H943_9ASTR